jgi:hypothetical protein
MDILAIFFVFGLALHLLAGLLRGLVSRMSRRPARPEMAPAISSDSERNSPPFQGALAKGVEKLSIS